MPNEWTYCRLRSTARDVALVCVSLIRVDRLICPVSVLFLVGGACF